MPVPSSISTSTAALCNQCAKPTRIKIGEVTIKLGQEEKEIYYLGSELLDPGQVREGWLYTAVPLDYEPKDLEIYFIPFLSEEPLCIWKLE